jgi:hypothetical protein
MNRTLQNPLGGRRGFSTWLIVGVLAVGVAGCETELGDDPKSNDQASPPATSTPSETAAASYRVVGGGKVLVDPSGTRIPIEPKLVTGYVDSGRLNGDFIDMSGWAAPADLSKPADVIVAVAGGKSVATVVPSGERTDLVEGYDRPGLAKAGFAMSIPRSALDCSAPSQGLKTFAVSGSSAGPLEWLSDVPERVSEAAC